MLVSTLSFVASGVSGRYAATHLRGRMSGKMAVVAAIATSIFTSLAINHVCKEGKSVKGCIEDGVVSFSLVTAVAHIINLGRVC